MPEKICSTCQCNKVCDHNKYGFENCGNYISADLVPREEVEEWICRCREWHGVAELKSQRILELEAELSKAKADTVRKMQKMLKEKAMDVDTDDAALWMECVTIEDVNQIAKELLEDKA